MRIAGFEKNSAVDYPGKISAVVFTPGCNMDCYYCHNRSLLSPGAEDSLINPQAVFEFLKVRKFIIDAVVITGGEPTSQKDLENFIRRVKKLGLLVKLDTNGTRPWIIKSLLEQNLIDFIAMDIKAPAEKYQQIAGTKVDLTAIEKSIDLILASDIPHEFRTTVAPGLTRQDIVKIAVRIRGAHSYTLQQYRQPGIGVDLFGPVYAPNPLPDQLIFELAQLADTIMGSAKTRGLDLPADHYQSKMGSYISESQVENSITFAHQQSVKNRAYSKKPIKLISAQQEM